MAVDNQITEALRSTDEIEIMVIGRSSGREVSLPVWFVEESRKVYLVPVSGSDSNWFKNVLKTPRIRIAANGAELTAIAKPTRDPAKVGHVLEKFREKYGADQISRYYRKLDVAVEVPLVE